MAPVAYNSPRRREAAAQTRQAILDAARSLFAEHGYPATTIQEIAAAARVATATVYASVGGKAQLLEHLITLGAGDAELRQGTERVAASDDPAAIVRDSVANTRFAVEKYGDVFELMLVTARGDAAVAAAAGRAEEGFRATLRGVATRLGELDALPGTAEQAVDVFAYYLDYTSWRRLVSQFGWSYPQAEEWLTGRITEALRIPA
ncbi:TetR/AcrR family transcriptional regulator [Amycolatopsis sp. NPDC005003]